MGVRGRVNDARVSARIALSDPSRSIRSPTSHSPGGTAAKGPFGALPLQGSNQAWVGLSASAATRSTRRTSEASVNFSQGDDRSLFAGSRRWPGRGPGSGTRATPKCCLGPRVLSRPAGRRALAVFTIRPDRYRGSGGDRDQGTRWCLRPAPGIPGSIRAASPDPSDTPRCGSAAVRVPHRRGAFLRTQQVRVRQAIDLIVDLVEPPARQGRARDPGPRCAARDTSKRRRRKRSRRRNGR